MIPRRVFLARTLLLAAGATVMPRPSLGAAPARIVSVGGAMTEIVCALGDRGKLAAVDTTSLYPAAVLLLPKVGYLRQLSTEGILSLKPDLILADVDAGPKDVLDQLQRMGAPVAHFSPERAIEHSAASVAPKIRFAGAALSKQAEADRLAADFASDLAGLDAAVAGLSRKPTVLFVMAAGTTGLRGAGHGTAAAEMIARAGAVNAFGAVEGYKPVSAEAALAANPDYLLFMRQSVDELGGVDGIAKLPALQRLDAAQQGRVLAMDGDFLLGLGPRTAHAARDLAVLLHPGQSIPALPPRPWTAEAA